jgi:hypothetical protein
MRERTTWNRADIQKQAASMSKRAEDPTAMNQDHLSQQPSAEKYLTGDPSTFAEDVHPNDWSVEYSNGQTSRNEIGMPEMRNDTFNHPEKTAALDEETLVKKANLCCKVARQILGSKAVEAAIEDQALALMNLSDSDLIATVNRMAQDQDQDQGQQEQKQAKDLPPEFLENIQKKKDEAKDKKEAQDQGQQDQDQGQKQAQMPDFIKEKIEEKKEKDDKEASAPKQATLDQMAQQIQTMAQQIQQMMQGQQQQQVVEQAPQQVEQQSNDEMIDQMLAQGQQPQQQMANDFGIQMDSPQMDIGEVGMGPEDDVLSTLFANNTEVQNAQQAHVLQHGAPASMQMTASGPMSRTASTRTVGTRPTGGVASIGGLGSPASAQSGGDVEKLSNLWNSAPDVSDVFRS